MCGEVTRPPVFALCVFTNTFGVKINLLVAEQRGEREIIPKEVMHRIQTLTPDAGIIERLRGQ